jgi:hypothetical protein
MRDTSREKAPDQKIHLRSSMRGQINSMAMTQATQRTDRGVSGNSYPQYGQTSSSASHVMAHEGHSLSLVTSLLPACRRFGLRGSRIDVAFAETASTRVHDGKDQNGKTDANPSRPIHKVEISHASAFSAG